MVDVTAKAAPPVTQGDRTHPGDASSALPAVAGKTFTATWFRAAAIYFAHAARTELGGGAVGANERADHLFRPACRGYRMPLKPALSLDLNRRLRKRSPRPCFRSLARWWCPSLRRWFGQARQNIHPFTQAARERQWLSRPTAPSIGDIFSLLPGARLPFHPDR